LDANYFTSPERERSGNCGFFNGLPDIPVEAAESKTLKVRLSPEQVHLLGTTRAF